MAMVSLQAMYDDARRLLEGGDVDQVIGIARHMLVHYPEYLEANRILGEAYLAERQIDKAIDAFAQVLRSDPENIPAHVGLGIAYERLGKASEAISEFEKALEIKPDLAELRSQLLRLYTDTWGSENAQLRLSRAGLARLYVKGHMLPQAIQEFRAVVADQPQRLDTHVALAEALWRDNQENIAVDVCQGILRDYPDALKPNLMMGYLLLSSGDPDGEKFWNKAKALDPYMGVARSLFETLPVDQVEQPLIPEFDEQDWLQQIAQERQAAQETLAAAPVVAAATASAHADDLFGNSWLSNVEQSAAPPAAVPEMMAPEDNDFLASLLAMDTSPPLPTAEAPVPGDIDVGAVEPFSLDDLESGAVAKPVPQPFGLDDLGLDAPEAAVPPMPEVPEAPEVAGETEVLTPFNLDDLGLDAPEAAVPLMPEVPEAPEVAGETEVLTPFNLDDLGLDVPEATISPMPEVPEAQQEVVQPVPFNLDDLGLDDDVAPSPFSLQDLGLEEPPAAVEEPDLKPFSLADLGLTDDEIASLSMADTAAAPDDVQQSASPTSQNSGEVPAELRPFSLDELDIDMGIDSQDASIPSSLPPSLQPFSLDEAMLTMPDSEPPLEDAPAELAPLSADDEPSPGTYSWQEPSSRLGAGFLKSTPPTGEEAASEASIFSKLLQRRQADEAAHPPEPPEPPLEVRDDELDMSLFSLDDVPLHDEALEPGAEQPRDQRLGAGALGAGLLASARPPRRSEEAPPPTAQPVGQDVDIASASLLTQEEAPLPTSPQAPASDEEPELVPFSLAELGLSEEEIAALGLGESVSTTADIPLPAPEPTLDLTLDSDPSQFTEPLPSLSESEIQSVPAATSRPAEAEVPEEPELKPFSLSELGLSDDEIAALGLDDSGVGDDEAASDDTSGLGFSMEEIEAFDFGELTGPISPAGGSKSVTPPSPSAPPTDEPEPVELDAFDFSGLDSLNDLDSGAARVDADTVDMDAFDFSDLDSLSTSTSAAPPPVPPADLEIADIESAVEAGELQPFSLADLGLSPEEIAALGLDASSTDAAAPSIEETSLQNFAGDFDVPVTPPAADADEDFVLSRLLDLGHRQGFVDINDIIAVVDDPVSEADRIEAIGMQLHEAGIQIRDGDEVIDMDEVEYTDEDFEGEFVGEDYDGETTLPAQVPDAAEPELTPFSLAELGLSDEEIALLGLNEADVSEAAPIQSQPFSLTELGLSDEPTAVPPAASDEPELTPFSLAELGLSDEEIAALNLEEAAPTPPTAQTPAPELPPLPATALPSQDTSPPSAEQEPELTPFSLAELGLSDEEIATLGLAEADAAPSTELPQGDDQPVADSGLQSSAPAAGTSAADLVDDDIFAGLDSLDSLSDIPSTPAPEASASSTKASPLSVEDKAALAEKKGLVSSLLADLRGASERAVRANPERTVEPEPETVETFETLVPSIDAEATLPPAPAGVAAVSQSPAAKPIAASAPPAANLEEGSAVIDEYLKQIKADPDNPAIRLAVARLGNQVGRRDIALDQYKLLIKHNYLVDQVVDDLRDLISESDDSQHLQRLHRVLGDAYSKQGRYREAINEYSWTFSRS